MHRKYVWTLVLSLLAVVLMAPKPRYHADQIDYDDSDTLQAKFDAMSVFNVMDSQYGAVADAIEAGSCDANEDIPMNCTPDASPGTDDTAAFQAAVDEACTVRNPDSTTGGIIHMPVGKYRLNSSVFVRCSNILVRGEGHGTVLLPGAVGGMIVFQVCQGSGSSCDVPPSDKPKNVHFRNFTIRDDYPQSHGSTWSEQISVTGIDGAFVFEEELDFDGTSPDAAVLFYWQSTELGDGELIFRGSTTSAYCSSPCSGEIEGARSGTTAQYASATWVHQSAESQAILMYADDSSIVGMRFDYLGEEAVLIGQTAENPVVDRNIFWNNPSLPSKGASIAVTNQGENIHITNNYIQMGANFNTKGININPSTQGDINNVIIQGNTIEDDDIGTTNLHRLGDWPIVLQANTSDLDRAVVDSNTIDFDVDTWGSCHTAGTFCNAHSDCDADDWCEDWSGCADCAAILVSENSGGEIFGITVSNNHIVGGFKGNSNGDGSITTITGNTFESDGSSVFAVKAHADKLITDNNSMRGFAQFAVLIDGAVEDAVIDGNLCHDIGGDARGGIQTAIIDAESTVMRLVISNNVIVGTASAAAIYGIDCFSADQSVVSGNIIQDADNDAIRACHNVIGNHILDAGSIGVRMSAGDSGGRIVGNTIDGASTAIYLNSATDVQVLGNRCVDPTSNTCVLEAGSADRNIVTGNNTVDSGGAGAITCIGSDSICKDNIVDGTMVFKLTPRYWSAWAFTVDGTNCIDPTGIEIPVASGGPIVGSVVCADDDASMFYVDMKLPADWSAGNTMAVTIDLSPTTASTDDIDIDVAGMCRSHDDEIDTAWGSKVAVGSGGSGSDGITLTNNADDLIQATSDTLTPSGTCAAGDHLFLAFEVDDAGTGAAIATTNLLGVTLDFD